jgi:hypothetical protein
MAKHMTAPMPDLSNEYSNLGSDLPISAKPTAAMTTKSQRGH